MRMGNKKPEECLSPRVATPPCADYVIHYIILSGSALPADRMNTVVCNLVARGRKRYLTDNDDERLTTGRTWTDGADVYG